MKRVLLIAIALGAGWTPAVPSAPSASGLRVDLGGRLFTG